MAEDTYTRRTVVVMEVTQDIEYGTVPEPNWWNVLGLPEPWRFDEAFPNAHIKIVLERDVEA